MTSGRNRLDSQTSPYLLQHADNPVHWQPWDDAAIDAARRSGKPILLSIGYSACHWCHVMAHESFEDETTAAVMNEHFVNIKIDREERPDLDKIYQLAHQLLTQQTGGWPLTMFLDPRTLVPFFGGTYFPKTPRYQLPGFTDLLRRIAQAFEQQHEELATQGDKLVHILDSLNAPQSDVASELDDATLLEAARETLGEQYDPNEGGFGGAPKFPMPVSLDRLLSHWAESSRRGDNDRDALDMVMNTLTKIARGGIYDHLGGGFCRYATDARWMIPHFEKMLYDNGALLSLYSDALAVGPDSLFEGAVRDTANWVLKHMQHAEGGYFSAQDADSEGEEGKYYVWRRDQVKRLLSEDEYLVAETLYGLDKPANFDGKFNLHRYDAWHSVVDRLSMDPAEAEALLASARSKLLAARETRVPPAKDDKVLTAWNGLAIKGMAKAGTVLHEPAWVASASRAADFMRTVMIDDGRLRATWRNGVAKYPAYLDDYANLLDGLLALLAARWRDADAAFAVELAEAALINFEDKDAGGFYFTAHDHEQLIHRPKPTTDDALPPGNAVLAQALMKLGHLFAEPRYLDAAHNTLSWARMAMEKYPAGHCSLLAVLEAETYPGELVIIRGPEAETGAWQQAATQGYKPWRHTYVIPYDATQAPGYLPRLVDSQVRERTTAFVCQGLVCGPPIERLDTLKSALGQGQVLAFPKR